MGRLLPHSNHCHVPLKGRPRIKKKNMFSYKKILEI